MEANIELQDLALQLHKQNVLDDDDFFMLLDAPRPIGSLHSALPCWCYAHLNLEGMTDDECKVEFRFGKDDLHTCSYIPTTRGDQVLQQCCDRFMYLLKRYAYHCRYADLIPRFGRPISRLCMAVNLITEIIYNRYCYLTELDQP